jgi:pimeloyl-ACP methyl ester carboxylesterase
MAKATSADGTTITYDAYGDGPPLVLVGGAFNDRGTWTELAQALAAEGFTGVTYDRRGRGDSGDTPPYAIEREVEDLAAVVDAVAARGPVGAHGNSSGAALLLRAAAGGLGVRTVSVLEPPYRIAGAPPPPERYVETLTRYVDAGDRAGLVEYFQTQVVGLPAEAVASFRGTPMWAGLEALSPTLVYDAYALGGDDHALPTEMLAHVDVPVLAIGSTGTAAAWLPAAAEAVAGAVPHGRFERLEGGYHQVPPEVLVPALVGFHRQDGSPHPQG